MVTGPLKGMLVLDFSTLLPGPLATLLLAEAGATVIKIERPGGDEMRGYTPRIGGTSVNFALLNRGKRSLELDLKSPAAREELAPMVERADVLVEQFRPGVMSRLGLGYDDVRAVNEGIIYCSITGYGQQSPRAQVAAHDLNYVSDVGLLDLIDGPSLPHALIADIGCGSYPAVINILLALAERERTGRGCHLDVAMADGMFTWLYAAVGGGLAGGNWPRRGRELLTGGSPRYRLYRTADDRYIAVGALEDRFWGRLCDLIGLPADLREDGVDAEVAVAAVAALIAEEVAVEWERRFAGSDVCCSIVRTVEEGVAAFASRGLFARTTGDGAGATMPALPVPIDAALRSDEVEPMAPVLGEYRVRGRAAM